MTSKHTKQTFSFRKFKFGLASALIGLTTFGIMAGSASADEASSSEPSSALVTQTSDSTTTDTEASTATTDTSSSATTDATSTDTTASTTPSTATAASTESSSTASNSSEKASADSVVATTEASTDVSAESETNTSQESTTTENTTDTSASTEDTDNATSETSTASASDSTTDTQSVTVSADTTTTIADNTSYVISSAGTYTFTGTATNSSIIVSDDVSGQVTVNLDNVNITNSAPAISSQGLATVLLATSGTNNITSTSSVGINVSGDLNFSGDGYTAIASGSGSNGIYGDTVTIESGTYVISSGSDGIEATTAINLLGGDITIIAGGQGMATIDTENLTIGDITIDGANLTITSTDRGIHAGHNFTLNSGNVSIKTDDEGIEAWYLTINGGTLYVDAADDGLNATPNANAGMLATDQIELNINGGTVYVNAGGDGFDSNGNLTITGGTIVVYGGSGQDGTDTALDYDGEGIITGGTLIAGSANAAMAEAFDSSSSQDFLATNLTASAGETVTITDSAGNTVTSFTTPISLAHLVYSSASLTDGSDYTITTGSNTTTTTASTEYTNTNAPGGQGGPMNGQMPGDGTTPPALPDGTTPSDMPTPPNGSGAFDGTVPSDVPTPPNETNGTTPPERLTGDNNDQATTNQPQVPSNQGAEQGIDSSIDTTSAQAPTEMTPPNGQDLPSDNGTAPTGNNFGETGNGNFAPSQMPPVDGKSAPTNQAPAMQTPSQAGEAGLTLASQTNSQKATTTSLPETGESQSRFEYAGVGLIGLATTLGLAGLKKKKEDA